MPCQRKRLRSQYCGGKAQSPKRKSRHTKKSAVRKCRPGKITRNPFLNFLREFRAKHCDWGVIKVAIEGGKCWCKLNDHDRDRFYKEACQAPKIRRSRSRRRHRSHSRRSSRGRKSRRHKTHSGHKSGRRGGGGSCVSRCRSACSTKR